MRGKLEEIPELLVTRGVVDAINSNLQAHFPMKLEHLVAMDDF